MIRITVINGGSSATNFNSLVPDQVKLRNMLELNVLSIGNTFVSNNSRVKEITDIQYDYEGNSITVTID